MYDNSLHSYYTRVFACTGSVVEKTFRAGESLSGADISKRAGQFTYAEGEEYVFMVGSQRGSLVQRTAEHACACARVSGAGTLLVKRI